MENRMLSSWQSPWRGLAVALVLTLVVPQAVILPASAAEPASAVRMPKAAVPPVVDGVLDDACWQRAPVAAVDFVMGKLGQKAGRTPMQCRLTWDDQYLFIGYETFDDNLVAVGTGEEQGPAANRREGAKIYDPPVKIDVVEFFITCGDEHFFWEVHHNASNQFNDVWCAVIDDKQPAAKTTMARYGIHFGHGEFLDDDAGAKARFAAAVKLKPQADGVASTVNDESDTDTGYTAELRLPWTGLGAPLDRETWITVEPTTPNGEKVRYHGPWKMSGAEIRVLAVCQNGDLQDRYHHDAPLFPGGWFHKGAPVWPRYLLVGDEGDGQP
jgi:hypothetical protein